MSRVSLADESQAAAAKLTLPVTVVGAQMAGWGPQEWVYTLTAIYLVLQSLYLCWKWWKEAHKPDDADADE